MSVKWGTPAKRGPSWEELVNQATLILGSDMPELLRLRGTDLQILEYFRIVKGGNLAELTNWLSNEFSSASDEDIMTSPLFSELSLLSKCNLYYTTNYDDFVERALRNSERRSHVVTSEHTINHDRAAVEVVKFHGDFNSPEQMVLSESQYMERMRLESPLDFKLRSDLLGRAVLFIGYSFRDANVAYIFHAVNRLFSLLPDSYSGRRAFILLSEPSEFERRLFHARNIDVIAVRKESIANAIADLLKEMRS